MKKLKLFDNETAAADKQSVWVNLWDNIYYNIGVKFSGSDVVGTVTLDAFSGGENPNVSTADGIVATISNSSRSITASSDVIYDGSAGTGVSWVRVNWDYTSGTGNISAWIEIKEKNAE